MYPNSNGNSQQQYPEMVFGQGQPATCYPNQAPCYPPYPNQAAVGYPPAAVGYPPTSGFMPPAASACYPPNNGAQPFPGQVPYCPSAAGAAAEPTAAEIQHAQEKLELEKELLRTQRELVGLKLEKILTTSEDNAQCQSENESDEEEEEDWDAYSEEEEDYVYDDEYEEIPTIVEGQFDAASDAKILRKAMKGFGTDEAAIINILARRTNDQRQEIAQAFKTAFGRDLVKDLKSELGGKLEDVVLALMTPRFEYLAKKLNKAMKGLGTKESVLVDILCTSHNYEIEEINAAYSSLFNKSLESDLMGDTSGAFRKLMVSVNSAGRNEEAELNETLAEEDAHALYKAGEKKMGTDEETFNMILATRSYAQIRLMLNAYERITGHSFTKAIKKEFSGTIRNGLLAVVKSSRNKAAYFAGRLQDSMAGLGTNDDDLIFLVVTRSEIDMENIKQEYSRKYHKPLAKDISGDCSGDYKKILLAMIGE